jgi:cysteine desulfurase
VRPEVLEAMLPYLTERFGNPSSHHTVGEAAAAALADARAKVAAVLGVRTNEVVFTSGGTEADNLAIKGLAIGAALRRDGRRSRDSPVHVITTPIEHEAVLASCDYLERVHGFDVTLVPVDDTGAIDPADVAAAIRPETAVVSIGYANNEIGTVQDVAALAEVTTAARVPLHLDAVQAAGGCLRGTGADALSLAGHKIGAPQGIGVLAVRARLPLEPVLHGGGQERGRRSGTENLAGAVAFATALELAEAERESAAERVGALRDAFVERVLAHVPTAQVTGHPTRGCPARRASPSRGRAARPCSSNSSDADSSPRAGRRARPGATSPRTCSSRAASPDIAQSAVRFTFGHALTADLSPIADAVAAAVSAVRSGT